MTGEIVWPVDVNRTNGGRSEEPMIISHDLGTSGNKASLHEPTGRLVAAVTVDYPTRFGDGGVAEQDPDEWWTAVATATRLLLDETGTAPSAIDGLGISGQMMGAVFLDARRRPTRPAIIWADHRSTAEADLLTEAIGLDAAYRLLGHRVHPTYTLAKIMWVRTHQPDVWARTRHVCTAKDYVTHRLTGELVTDPSDASGTNAFDQRTGEWSAELLDAAGLDASLLPPVVPSTSVAGGLTPEASEHTGLPAGTPVVVGGGDGPMAAVGAGVIEPADGAYVCLGSSSWVSASALAPLHDPELRSMTFNHVVPGRYVPTATMQAGGASLTWVMELVGAGPRDFAEHLAAAAGVGAADEGLYFLPYLLGERSPHWNAAAAGTFAGLERHHTAAHLVRAVLEGVAFNLRTCIEAFTENGVPIDGVDAIGGGASSDVWLQVMADVWQVPVRRRSIVAEANSLGAAVTAAVGLGVVDDFSVARELSAVTAEFVPDGGRATASAAQHDVFRDAYVRLEPWFARRREGSAA
jgi:xylulokinase